MLDQTICAKKNKTELTLRFFLCILIFFLTSCSVGPDYVAPQVATPYSWKNSQDDSSVAYASDYSGQFEYLDHWWEVFEDCKLNELEQLAIAHSRTLVIVYERIEEARAIAGIAASNLYPQVTVNPLANNTVYLNENNVNPQLPFPPVPNNNIFRVQQGLYSLPFNFSYEVDLWGKLRDGYDAAKYSFYAQECDFEAVMLSLTSTLASVYYQLRSLDSELDLLAKVLQTRQTSLEINQARFEEKISNYSDVTLAQEQVDIVRKEISETERLRELFENQLAVLIGIPASDFCLAHMPLVNQPPCIPAGIPSEIMLRRPDISEAEYFAMAQNANVKLAYAQFFPSLTLTATTGFESPVLHDFLQTISRYWFDQVEVDQVIFDGGALKNNYRLQYAKFREASAAYQQVVLRAFQEVEDSLKNIESYAEQFQITGNIVKESGITNQIYTDRFAAGIINYIDVANTERDLLNFQITYNTLQGLRYVATIQLIKALGGGWHHPERENICYR